MQRNICVLDIAAYILIISVKLLLWTINNQLMDVINMKPNIRLQYIKPNEYKIILCNAETLELDYIPAIGTSDDIVIQWPINPHFTGRSMIATMLNAIPQFKEVIFI